MGTSVEGRFFLKPQKTKTVQVLSVQPFFSRLSENGRGGVQKDASSCSSLGRSLFTGEFHVVPRQPQPLSHSLSSLAPCARERAVTDRKNGIGRGAFFVE